AGDWIIPSDANSDDVRVAEPAATTDDEDDDERDGWTAAASTVFAADPRSRARTAGWGGSRSARRTEDDQETITSFADELTSLEDESPEVAEAVPAALAEDDAETSSEWVLATNDEDEFDEAEEAVTPVGSIFETEPADQFAVESLEAADED